MSWTDNFKLGLAGAADLTADVFSLGFYKSHLAAGVYADQVARDPSLSESKALTQAAEDGVSVEQLREQAKTAAVAATDKGAVKEAVKKTADQIGEKVAKIADDTGSNLPWILGGAAVLGVVVFAWRAAR